MGNNSIRAYARQIERSHGVEAPRSVKAPVPTPAPESRGTGIAISVALCGLLLGAAAGLIWIGRPDLLLFVVAGAFAVASIIHSFTDYGTSGE